MTTNDTSSRTCLTTAANQVSWANSSIIRTRCVFTSNTVRKSTRCCTNLWTAQGFMLLRNYSATSGTRKIRSHRTTTTKTFWRGSDSKKRSGISATTLKLYRTVFEGGYENDKQEHRKERKGYYNNISYYSISYPPLLFDKQITHIFVKIKKFLICSFLNKSAKCPFFRHFVDRQSLPQRLNITENLQ